MIYSQLYKCRRKIDCANQPRFFDIFNDIDTDLRIYHGRDDYHPYETNPSSNFTSNTCYYEGDRGWFIASIRTESDFLYRIDNIPTLLVRSPIGNQNVCNKDILREEYGVGLDGFICNLIDHASVMDLFKRMQEKSKWIPLNDLLLEYNPTRNLTWWTDQNLSSDISPETIMTQALKLGTASNRVIKPTVLMRLNLSIININTLLNVPSVIDAFNNPIFASQNQEYNPSFGTPIDLTNFTISSYRDFVVRNVPLEAIEILPVSIPIIIKDKFEKKGESDSFYNEILKLYDKTLKADGFNL